VTPFAGAAPVLLHVDEACLVALKPAGLPAVPGRSAELHDCLAARVNARFTDARVVHRLDMATSGVMLFARGEPAQRALSIAFARREIEKHYVAVVDGLVEADESRIELPLAADWPNRPRQIVDPQRGKPSLTHYRVLARDTAQRRTRLALVPVTGRSHQLRVHLMAIGHPILGDALYAPPAVQAAAARLLLHAKAIAFAHPATGARITVEAAAPF
jgi:tRNA pseudouridine32 synthase/23S rRNA pseudouridine746 synthase